MTMKRSLKFKPELALSVVLLKASKLKCLQSNPWNIPTSRLGDAACASYRTLCTEVIISQESESTRALCHDAARRRHRQREEKETSYQGRHATTHVFRYKCKRAVTGSGVKRRTTAESGKMWHHC